MITFTIAIAQATAATVDVQLKFRRVNVDWSVGTKVGSINFKSGGMREGIAVNVKASIEVDVTPVRTV